MYTSDLYRPVDQLHEENFPFPNDQRLFRLHYQLPYTLRCVLFTLHNSSISPTTGDTPAPSTHSREHELRDARERYALVLVLLARLLVQLLSLTRWPLSAPILENNDNTQHTGPHIKPLSRCAPTPHQQIHARENAFQSGARTRTCASAHLLAQAIFIYIYSQTCLRWKHVYV